MSNHRSLFIASRIFRTIPGLDASLAGHLGHQRKRIATSPLLSVQVFPAVGKQTDLVVRYNMCASFAPPKPPSGFTVGKAGQESAGASRRRQNSSPRPSRSPSPLSHESLNGAGGHAFSKEDFANALAAAGSLSGGGGGSDGRFFTPVGRTPTPLSTSQSLSGYSLDKAGPSSAPSTMTAASAAVPFVSPSGTAADSATDSPTAVASGAARSSAAASVPSRPATVIPSFSEIAQGAMRAGGDLSLEPFARSRIRAAEEGWARQEAERQEREKRWRVRMLSGATLLVLLVVLACRWVGVGIVISGPAGTAPPAITTKPSSGTAPQPQSFLSSAAAEMPAIASSKHEFVAALNLAGLKRPKPAKVDRAWSALTSGQNRGGAGTRGYIGGAVLLAAKVVVAASLRNPDLVAVLALAVALTTFLLSPPRKWRPSWGRSAVGKGGDRAVRSGGGAANGNGSTRAAGLRRQGSRGAGAGGVGPMSDHVGNGVGTKSGVGVRGSSSLSPRRRVGS